jgi:hypothetical protein
MNWGENRGTALDKPSKNNINIRLIEYRILYIVKTDLKMFHEKININNIYGKWLTK